jgi:hypothetical protein
MSCFISLAFVSSNILPPYQGIGHINFSQIVKFSHTIRRSTIFSLFWPAYPFPILCCMQVLNAIIYHVCNFYLWKRFACYLFKGKDTYRRRRRVSLCSGCLKIREAKSEKASLDASSIPLAPYPLTTALHHMSL